MLYKMLTDRILNHLATNTSIDMGHREIYAYSLERYISGFVNFIVFAIVAAICGIPVETVVFGIFYGPLRKYAGGYHAKTRSKCMVLSIFILLSLVKLAEGLVLLSYWKLLTVIFLLIAGLLIFWLAPVDSENRRLSEEVKKQYRRKSRWIFAVDCLFIILTVACLESFGNYILIGSLAVFLEGIFLVPHKLTMRQKYAPR